MSSYGIFDSAVASEQEVGLIRQAAVDKMAEAVYDVREKLGPVLFASADMEEFRHKVAMMKRDQSLYRVIEAHVFPNASTVRRIVGKGGVLEKEFRAFHTAAPGDPGTYDPLTGRDRPGGTPGIFEPGGLAGIGKHYNPATGRDDLPATPGPTNPAPTTTAPTTQYPNSSNGPHGEPGNARGTNPIPGTPGNNPVGGAPPPAPKIDQNGAVTPPGAPPAAPGGGGWKANDIAGGSIPSGEYTIKPGDTLAQIAQGAGIKDYNDIAKANTGPNVASGFANITDPNKINAGDKITIPGGQTAGERAEAISGHPTPQTDPKNVAPGASSVSVGAQPPPAAPGATDAKPVAPSAPIPSAVVPPPAAPPASPLGAPQGQGPAVPPIPRPASRLTADDWREAALITQLAGREVPDDDPSDEHIQPVSHTSWEDRVSRRRQADGASTEGYASTNGTSGYINPSGGGPTETIAPGDIGHGPSGLWAGASRRQAELHVDELSREQIEHQQAAQSADMYEDPRFHHGKDKDPERPLMSLDQTFSPSDKLLKPKDDWEGYKSRVDQGAAKKVKKNFAALEFAAYSDWCRTAGLSPARLSSLDHYAANLTDEQYMRLAATIQAAEATGMDWANEYHPSTPKGQGQKKLKDVTASRQAYTDFSPGDRPVSRDRGIADLIDYHGPHDRPGSEQEFQDRTRASDDYANRQNGLHPGDEALPGLSQGEDPEQDNLEHERDRRQDRQQSGHYWAGRRDPLVAYNAWCEANNLKKISANNVAYFAGPDIQLCGHLAMRMKRAIHVARQRQAGEDEDHDPDDGFGGKKAPPFGSKDSRRRTAAPDYLRKADDALTQLLQQKQQEFQEQLAPLQQALVTVQQAEQLQQQQNPMNVLPPQGTVNVMPGGDQGQAGMPAAGAQDLGAAAQALAGGGAPPGGAPGGGGPDTGQGGPPPAAAGGGLPPDVQQQMLQQTARRKRGGQGKGRGATRPRQAASVFNLWQKWQQNPAYTSRGGDADYDAFAQQYGVGAQALNKLKAHHQTGLMTAGYHDYIEGDPNQIFAPQRGHGWEHDSGPSGPPYVRPQLDEDYEGHPTSHQHEAAGLADPSKMWNNFNELSGFSGGGGAGGTGVGGTHTVAPKPVGPSKPKIKPGEAIDDYYQRTGSRHEGWSGWGPAVFPKTRQVVGWNWDEHLNGYLANHPQKFACDCKEAFDAPTGYHRCKCGKAYNSYVIGTTADRHEASTDKYIVREIPVRADVIVANREMVAAARPRPKGFSDNDMRHQEYFDQRVEEIKKDQAARGGTPYTREDLNHRMDELGMKRWPPREPVGEKGPPVPHLDPRTGEPAVSGTRWGSRQPDYVAARGWIDIPKQGGWHLPPAEEVGHSKKRHRSHPPWSDKDIDPADPRDELPDHYSSTRVVSLVDPRTGQRYEMIDPYADGDEDSWPSDHHPETKTLKSTPADWHHRDKNQRWTANRRNSHGR